MAAGSADLGMATDLLELLDPQSQQEIPDTQEQQYKGPGSLLDPANLDPATTRTFKVLGISPSYMTMADEQTRQEILKIAASNATLLAHAPGYDRTKACQAVWIVLRRQDTVKKRQEEAEHRQRAEVYPETKETPIDHLASLSKEMSLPILSFHNDETFSVPPEDMMVEFQDFQSENPEYCERDGGHELHEDQNVEVNSERSSVTLEGEEIPDSPGTLMAEDIDLDGVSDNEPPASSLHRFKDASNEDDFATFTWRYVPVRNSGPPVPHFYKRREEVECEEVPLIDKWPDFITKAFISKEWRFVINDNGRTVLEVVNGRVGLLDWLTKATIREIHLKELLASRAEAEKRRDEAQKLIDRTYIRQKELEEEGRVRTG